MIGIYKITNLINNKCYIGQSINITQRFNHHRNFQANVNHYPLYRAFKKYGIDNFSFEILEECSKEELNEKEIYWIKYFNSYKDGYNQTEGGAGSPNLAVKLSNEDILIIYDLLQNSNITQREIAKQFNVGEDTISEINQGKTRIQQGYIFPLRERHKKNYCIDCGKEIYKTSTRCMDCDKKMRRLVSRPTREELKDLIRNKPFTQIASQFGVSDRAIRKWCDSMNLPRTKKDINSYSDEEWNNI